jgi:hypothetical protein
LLEALLYTGGKMDTTTVTATVSKKVNSVWAGKGKVISFSLEFGTVILLMLTGQYAGAVGAFDLDKVRFRLERGEKQ